MKSYHGSTQIHEGIYFKLNSTWERSLHLSSETLWREFCSTQASVRTIIIVKHFWTFVPNIPLHLSTAYGPFQCELIFISNYVLLYITNITWCKDFFHFKQSFFIPCVEKCCIYKWCKVASPTCVWQLWNTSHMHCNETSCSPSSELF